MTQRLPIPGSDNGTWGTILNGFLGVAHNADGTLIPSAVTNAGAASLASPSFTGTPTAPTATGGTNTTQIATTAFTTSAVGALGGTYVPMSGLYVLPVISGDMTSAINNALSTYGTVVLQGNGSVYNISGVVSIAPGQALLGQGGGLNNPATKIQCTATGAQVAFGARTVQNYGGRCGGFHVAGNAVATQPLYFGLCVQRTFFDIAVDGSLGVGALLEATQNCRFYGFDSENNASDGVVFDYGAGNNAFYGYELRGNGTNGTNGNCRFQQSGTSPSGAFSAPTDNRFIGGGGVFDPPASGAPYNIFHGNGSSNFVDACTVSLTGLSATASAIQIRRTNSALASLLRVGSLDLQGTSGQAILFDLLGNISGTQLIIEGYLNCLNAETLFLIDDLSSVEFEGNMNDWTTANITNFFLNANSGVKSWYQLIRRHTRSNSQFVAQTTGDDMIDVLLESDTISRLSISGSGVLSFSPDGATVGATLYPTTVASTHQALSTSGWLKIGNTSAALGAGTGAPTINAANGSVWLRTDGATGTTIYARVNSAWVEIDSAPLQMGATVINTTNATWPIPTGSNTLEITCVGGGGGGGGSAGSSSTQIGAAGGGGGAGLVTTAIMSVSGATTLNVQVATSGGTAGTAGTINQGASGQSGGQGGTVSVTNATTSQAITAVGGGGGKGGAIGGSTSVNGGAYGINGGTTAAQSPGAGGASGASDAVGGEGGAALSYSGSGGGGGGGANAGTANGTGGSSGTVGGTGASGGSGGGGGTQAGATAAANSGAGGGGAGGTMTVASTGAAGAAGGVGGSGYVMIKVVG